MSLEDQDIDEDDLAREIMQVQDDNDYEDDYDEIVDGVPEDEAMQLAEQYDQMRLPHDDDDDDDGGSEDDEDEDED